MMSFLEAAASEPSLVERKMLIQAIERGPMYRVVSDSI